MLLLSWLAGVPLPVAAAVFDMGKRGHKKNRSPPSCANVHACTVILTCFRFSPSSMLRVQGQVLIHDSVNAMDLCGIVHFRNLVELELRLCMFWCK